MLLRSGSSFRIRPFFVCVLDNCLKIVRNPVFYSYLCTLKRKKDEKAKKVLIKKNDSR